MDLLYIDFTEMNLCTDGEEEIFVMMAAFTKCSVAAVTLNQQDKTVTKALVDRVVYTCDIP